MIDNDLELQAEKPTGEPLILEDVNLRAQLVMMDAFQTTTDDQLFFQSTTFAGIEVDRVRVRPDPLLKREPRDVVDLVADIKELVLIQPTDVVRHFYGDELPAFLIEVRKSGGEPDLVRLDQEEDEWELSRADPDNPWVGKVEANLRPLGAVIREYLAHGVPIEQFPLKNTIPETEEFDDDVAA